jgi:hypothetical protein
VVILAFGENTSGSIHRCLRYAMQHFHALYLNNDHPRKHPLLSSQVDVRCKHAVIGLTTGRDPDNIGGLSWLATKMHIKLMGLFLLRFDSNSNLKASEGLVVRNESMDSAR